MTHDEFLELTFENDYSDEARRAIVNAAGEWINDLGITFNWDYEPELFLRDVCSHPECTLVTATYIFLQGQPSYYAAYGVSDGSEKTVEFLSWLHDRINSGIYKTNPKNNLPSHDVGIVFDGDLEACRAKDKSSVPISVGSSPFAIGLDPEIVSDAALGISTGHDERQAQQAEYVSIASEQNFARKHPLMARARSLIFGRKKY